MCKSLASDGDFVDVFDQDLRHAQSSRPCLTHAGEPCIYFPSSVAVSSLARIHDGNCIPHCLVVLPWR